MQKNLQIRTKLGFTFEVVEKLKVLHCVMFEVVYDRSAFLDISADTDSSANNRYIMICNSMILIQNLITIAAGFAKTTIMSNKIYRPIFFEKPIYRIGRCIGRTLV